MAISAPSAAAHFKVGPAAQPVDELTLLRMELQKQEHTTATLAKTVVALLLRDEAHGAVIPREIALRAEGASVQVEETGLGNMRVSIVTRAAVPIIVGAK